MVVEVPMMILALIFSLFVGGLVGLLGGGGSILTVPLLLYALGMQSHEAIATSLLVVSITSAAALAVYARGGRVHWGLGLLFGCTSMIGAFGAGRIASRLPGTALLVGFGVIMVISSLAMMRKRRGPRLAGAGGRRVPLVILQGLGVGVITGLVGAGGGFIVVPALVLLGGLSMGEAVATSLLVSVLNTAAGLAGHLQGVSIDLGIAIPIATAASIGSFVGTQLTGRMHPDTLRRAFAWFVMVMAVFLLLQEFPRSMGYDIALAIDWPWVLGGSSVPLFLGVIDLRSRRRYVQAV